MGFNCAQEKAKFDREWLRLRKEYTDAGMSEAAIQKIYEYDWYCFCRNRAYERRATQMPPLEIDSPDDERRSALFRKNEALSASFDESAFPGRYAWIDTLEDARLLRAIMKLNKKDLELLTYVTLEGHGQEELARRWGCTQAAVAIRMKKIKKISKKGLTGREGCGIILLADIRRCGGMVDTGDLKSPGSNTVPVRVRSPAPTGPNSISRSRAVGSSSGS